MAQYVSEHEKTGKTTPWLGGNVSLKPRNLSSSQLILQCFQALGQDLRVHWRDLQTLAWRGKKEGLTFFTKTLPQLGKALLGGLQSGLFVLPRSFKGWRKSAIPHFMRASFSKVFNDNGELLKEVDSDAVASIQQMCFFAYKLEVPADEATERRVLESFLDTEEELAELNIEPDAILLMAQHILTLAFQGFRVEQIRPNHGPGTTANCPQNNKYEAKLTNVPASRLGSFHFFNSEDGLDRLWRYPTYNNHDFFTDDNVAEIILVPKDSRGPRIISREPFENQWIQQGIMRFMVDRWESAPWAGQVNFTDQKINQKLALEASRNRLNGTIDLKEASDRVHMDLVKILFSGVPELLLALIASRSSRTRFPLKISKIKGRRILTSGHTELKLNKFAPMGSACCFPVMASCLYSIMVAALIGLGVSFEEALRQVYVYGDDVVLPCRYAEYLMAVIERYGLKVNKEKSFYREESPFRESCGVDAINGRVVTPIRLRRCYTSDMRDLRNQNPSVLVSALETANLLTAQSRLNSAEILYRWVESWLGALPYGCPSSAYLCRWVPIGQEDSIPEWTIVHRGHLLKSVRNGITPFGTKMRLRAYSLQTVERVNQKTTAFGHWMRITPTIGSESTPKFGVFTLQKTVKLKVKWFSDLAMSPNPSCKWLPS